MANDAVWLKAAVQLCEVNGTLPFMNLDGVSSAKRDVRAAHTREVKEISCSACAATGASFRG